MKPKISIPNLFQPLAIATVLLAPALVPIKATAQYVPTNKIVTDGEVASIASAGGTIYLGGQFGLVGNLTGGGVPLDLVTGTPAPSFAKVEGAGGACIRAVVADGSGGWYISGAFTCVAGQSRQGLAHILSDGSLDSWAPTFASSTGLIIYALAYSGGVLYAGGNFYQVNGQTRYSLAAFNTSTGNLTSWTPGSSVGPTYVYSLLTSGTTVVVGGTFTELGGQACTNLGEVDSSGNLISWNPQCDNYVNVLALSGNTLYAGGNFANIGGQSRNGLGAVDLTTAAATAWNPNPNSYIDSLLTSGTTIFVGGEFTMIGGQPRNGLAALDPSTGLAMPWQTGVLTTNSQVNAIAVSGTTLYAGGNFTTIGGTVRNRLAAFDTTSGSLLSWDPESDGTVYALAISGSYLYAGGSYSALGVQPRNSLAAVDAVTGNLLPWNPPMQNLGPITSLLVTNNAVYMGGYFLQVNSQTRKYMAAVDPVSGSLLPWDPEGNNYVDNLQPSSNGATIFASGSFTTVGGVAHNYVAALDATTGTQLAWDPQVQGGSGVVYSLDIVGNSVYMGGNFVTVGGQVRNGAAEVDGGTAALLPWNPNTSQGVESVLVSGTTAYLAGGFGTVGGQARSGLAAVDATSGNLLTSWNPNIPSGVSNSLVLSGGILYAGGNAGLVAIDPSSGTTLNWNPALDSNTLAVAVTNGTVFAGGYQSDASCNPSTYFLSLTAPTPFPTSTPTVTSTGTPPTATFTSSPTFTATPSFTPTGISATPTPTASSTSTLTPTFSSTFTPTRSSTPSPTGSTTPVPPSCCSIVWSQTAGTLSSARGIAIDDNRNVGYVADGTTIRTFNLSTGASTGTVGAVGAWGTPQGIWVGGDGNLYVANYTQADIQKVDPVSGTVLATIGAGDGIGAVRGVFVDPNGDLYVASGANSNNLFRYVYTAPNTYNLVTLSLAVTLNTPTGVARSGKNLFICDSLNNRVVMLKESVTGSNNYDQATVLSGNSIPLNVPQELTEDLAGNIYVADYSNQAFAVWSPTGGFLYNCQNPSYGNPFGIGVDAQGYLYLADAGNQEVVKVNNGCITEPFYPTWSPTPTGTWYTSTPTATPSATVTPSATKTPTSTPTLTPTSSPTGVPSSTPTLTATNSPTGTSTASATASSTSSPSPSSTPTGVPSFTPTLTATNSPTGTYTTTSTPTPSPTQAVITVNPGTATPCSCPQSPGATNVTVVIVVLDNTTSTTINLTNITIVDSGTGNPATGITGITLYGNGSSMATTVFSGGSATFNTNYNITVSSSVTLTVEVSFSSSVSVGSTYQFTVSGITASNGQAVGFSGLPYTGASITIANPTPTPSANQASAGQVFLYPSPATGSTATLAYYMAQAGSARIRVWNETAELVAVLNDSNKGPGPQTSVLNLAGFSSGVYIYKVELQYLGGTTESLAPQQFVVIR